MIKFNSENEYIIIKKILNKYINVLMEIQEVCNIAKFTTIEKSKIIELSLKCATLADELLNQYSYNECRFYIINFHNSKKYYLHSYNNYGNAQYDLNILLQLFNEI